MADKPPLTRNIRWFQLAFGAFAGIVGYQFYLHATGAAPLSPGGMVLRIFALAGGLLVFAISLQNVYRFGLVPDYSLKCRFCNGPVNRYSEFCEHCGADLIAEEKLVPCPRCGAQLYEGTKHCPECGAPVAKPPKGKKGHKKRREEAEGWGAPIDATTGVPPPREDEGR